MEMFSLIMITKADGIECFQLFDVVKLLVRGYHCTAQLIQPRSFAKV